MYRFIFEGNISQTIDDPTADLAAAREEAIKMQKRVGGSTAIVCTMVLEEGIWNWWIYNDCLHDGLGRRYLEDS